MKNTPDISKTIGLLVAVNITQVLALATLTILAVSNGDVAVAPRSANQYLLVVIVAAGLLTSGLVSLRFRGMLARIRDRSRNIENALADTEKLNQTLKAQRHDFLNHLQVVYGLMELDEYKDAREYIEKVYNDIQKVSRVLKTSNPAVNALICAKMLNAEKRGVAADFTATSRLDGLPVPSWEFCRVLGNLIDNALDALEEKPDDRILKIGISEDLKSYRVTVEDNGPGIPENLRKKIFEPGFTTKGARGEGMGLAITKGILKEYGGDVRLTSADSSTVFEATVPKR